MVGKHYYLCSVIISNIMYICGYVVLKFGTWKFESLKFIIWYLIVDDLLLFISFYVKTYLFFNDSLTYIMKYKYLYIIYLFLFTEIVSYNLLFKWAHPTLLNLNPTPTPTRSKTRIHCTEKKKQVSVDYDKGKHHVSTHLTGLRKADIPRRYRLRVESDRFQKDWTVSEVVHQILKLHPRDDVEALLNRWIGRFARNNFPLLIRVMSALSVIYLIDTQWVVLLTLYTHMTCFVLMPILLPLWLMDLGWHHLWTFGF